MLTLRNLRLPTPNIMKPPDLPTLIRDFFEKYLVAQRGLSEHTVLAYRDTWKLFLQFASRRRRKSSAALELRGSERGGGSPLPGLSGA